MKKSTLLFALAAFMLLGVSTAKATIATDNFMASTNVSQPEYQYKIAGSAHGKYWGNTSQPVDETEGALYAFFATSGNFYNIYNVTTGKWAVYTDYIKSTYVKDTDKGRDKISWVSTRPETNNYAAWFKFNKITVKSTTVSGYSIEIANTNGQAGTFYLQYYGGLASFTHNSVGFYNKDGAADDQSAWALLEKTEKVTITYQIVDPESGEAIFSQDVKAKVGEPYPTPTAPNVWIIFEGVPEGNVTEEETVDLTYTSRYTCFASANDINQWYALDIHGNEGDYPVYTSEECDTMWAYNNTDTKYSKRRVAEGTADDYQHGAVISDYFAWGFVGDPFNGVKIYNKKLQKFAYFDGVPTGVTDRTKAPVWVNADEEEASVFSIVATTASVENGFSFQNKDASTAKNILNQKNYVVSGYNAADGGSAMRAWAINTVTAQQETTLTAEYGTLIIPFYSAIPEGVTVYSCAAVAGTTLTLTEEETIYPNVPYIIKGTAGQAYNFSNTSEGTYTDPATKGLLTGVYEATTAPVASYVLQNNTGVLGFYQVAAEAEPTVEAGHCYLTLPAPEAKVLYFDEATAIESIHNAEFIIHNDGKFLENGKIVIVKNNAKFNTAGQRIK